MYHRESKYAPEPKPTKPNNSDQDQFLTLQILQSGVEEDFIDPDRLSNRNYLSITLACMMVLHDLNDYLGNAENGNPMRGQTHDWVELTEWILQEEEGWEGCLEAVARALEN
ncbi:unnamed protein product [Aureobasidium pullulans]|nr:unnamed protein product [Aureobasidium pullulans]